MTPDRVHARLQALDVLAILDTPSEAAFDDVVALASDVCDAPVALVSLLDADRQWFKARVGFAPCETPLDQSICAYAVEGDDLFVIGDLTADPRTRDNPLVTGDPHVRFYAGMPLQAPDGAVIGTLCVLDTKTRPDGLSAKQASLLRALARQVATQLKLRAIAIAQTNLATTSRVENIVLRANDDRARAAQAAGRIASFEIDIPTDIMTVSDGFCEIFGLAPARVLSPAVAEALAAAGRGHGPSTAETRADGSAPLEVQYRIRRADTGDLRWIGRRAAFNRDPEGRITKMYGVVEDVTDRLSLEATQAALLEFGDKVSGMADTAAVVQLAGEILGKTLDVGRAGYAALVKNTDLFQIKLDWTAPGVSHLDPTASVSPFSASMARLAAGEIVVCDDIETNEALADDRAGYAAIGVRAFVRVPVKERDTLVGYLFVHEPDSRRWNGKDVDFVHAIADRTFAALAKLIAEQDQRLLNQELSHRLKNTLAMVQAIARQTLRVVPDQTPVEAFERRVFALGRAHDILLQRSWSAARISALVPAALRIVGLLDRYDISGPDIEVGPRATLSLSLLLHELATNAAKYGALSRDDGRVDLCWKVERTEGDATFLITWEEHGGPPVVAPARRGFGSKIIQMGLAGSGNADVQYRPEGLTAAFRATIQQMMAA